MTQRQIICVATGGYAHNWPECLASHRAYAERHGFAYELVDHAAGGGPHPKWLKFVRALERLKAGHDVMLIDADARILAAAPSFRAVLDRHPEADVFAADGRTGRPSSGVVLLRGGRESHAVGLLQTCLDNAATPVPREDQVTEEGENGHFIHYLQRQPFAAAFHRLDAAWNRTVPPVQLDDAIVHYTGPMRAAYLDSLDRIDFSRLESDRHPLLQHVPELACTAREAYVQVLKQTIDPARLSALAAEFEAGAGLAPPPVLGQAPVSTLWRIERATGWLERPTRLLMDCLIAPGATVIDIGAHIGYFTTAMASLAGPAGRVLAFEPHPDNVAHLRRATAGAAEVYQRALGDRRGEAVLHFGSGHTNHSLTRGAKATGSARVTMTTLDHIVAGLRLHDVDFIKCDAEGLESRILQGAEQTLRSNPGLVMVIEINPRQLAAAGASAGRVLEQLAETGFAMRRINDDYSLGPVNKVVGRATANYLAMQEKAWPGFESMLARRLGRERVRSETPAAPAGRP